MKKIFQYAIALLIGVWLNLHESKAQSSLGILIGYDAPTVSSNINNLQNAKLKKAFATFGIHLDKGILGKRTGLSFGLIKSTSSSRFENANTATIEENVVDNLVVPVSLYHRLRLVPLVPLWLHLQGGVFGSYAYRATIYDGNGASRKGNMTNVERFNYGLQLEARVNFLSFANVGITYRGALNNSLKNIANDLHLRNKNINIWAGVQFPIGK